MELDFDIELFQLQERHFVMQFGCKGQLPTLVFLRRWLFGMGMVGRVGLAASWGRRSRKSGMRHRDMFAVGSRQRNSAPTPRTSSRKLYHLLSSQ